MRQDGATVEPIFMFNILTELAIDSCPGDVWLKGPGRALIEAGLSPEDIASALGSSHDDAELVANGTWAACQTCGDPGPDPFPETEELPISE
jgi:hypothetical protein